MPNCLLPAGKQNQGRKTFDPISFGKRFVLHRVHLGDHARRADLFGHAAKRLVHHDAGAAPGRPKINQDWAPAAQKHIELFGVDRNRCSGRRHSSRFLLGRR